jgi:phosphoserine aminotransferase
MINFSPGPAMLPAAVRAQIAADWAQAVQDGYGIAEISHRGPEFTALKERCEDKLRALLGLGQQHRVMFMQGGANAQFVLLPMNFGAGRYVLSGHWGEKALAEAQKIAPDCACWLRAAADGELDQASAESEQVSFAYTHITSNETINGIQLRSIPTHLQQGAPLVADMSSDIGSYPVDYSQFGLVYAGAQKNLGIAGLTLVIAREDFLQQARADLPIMFSYREFAARDSLFNTPPTFAWYVTDLVLSWMLQQGGVAALAEVNQCKAETLYAVIDGSDFWCNGVAGAWRSWMNVTFRCVNTELETLFLQQAADHGMLGLKGHRAVGGMRASIYNAMPLASVQQLADFMREFERHHG